MSEQPEVQAGPIVKVARDLSEILRLHEALLTQAVHKATDRLMPGGEAMVALGHVANLESWENLNEASETLGRAYTSAEDEDPEDAWTAFQLIEFWSEAWRRERDAEYDMRPTLVSEASFLKHSLDWAWQHQEDSWISFAKDVNRARVSLENILYAGEREERTRVPCVNEECLRKPNLIKIYAAGDEHDDRWKCPACKTRYDVTEFQNAYVKRLRSDGALRHIPLRDAIGTLKGFGRSENTVRGWLKPKMRHEADICPECDSSWAPSKRDRDCPDCDTPLVPVHVLAEPDEVIEGYCEISTRKRFVWWPDLWRKHLSAETRKESA